QLAEIATHEALSSSRLDVRRVPTGLVLGTAISATIEMEAAYRGTRTLRPCDFRFGTATDHIADRLDLRGPRYTLPTACAAALAALGTAFNQIALGDADAMIATGSDATLCPIVYAAFSQIHALSKVNDAAVASIPFGTQRSGFVLGEGAASLLLAASDA